MPGMTPIVWCLFAKRHNPQSGTARFGDPYTHWDRAPRGMRRYTLLACPTDQSLSLMRVQATLQVLYPHVEIGEAMRYGRLRFTHSWCDNPTLNTLQARVILQPITVYRRPSGGLCSRSDATCLRRSGALLDGYKAELTREITFEQFCRSPLVKVFDLAQVTEAMCVLDSRSRGRAA